MIIICFIAIIVLVAIDQIIKLVVSHNIALYDSISVIAVGDKKIFNLTHILNDGAGWSIFSGKTTFLIILTSVFIVAAIIYMIKFAQRNILLLSSLSLIIAGGIGNLIDRVFRGGSVIDYIEAKFINFPIFNFADICVVFGAIMLFVYVIFFEKPKNKELDVVNE